jgi:hypothetical protein
MLGHFRRSQSRRRPSIVSAPVDSFCRRSNCAVYVAHDQRGNKRGTVLRKATRRPYLRATMTTTPTAAEQPRKPTHLLSQFKTMRALCYGSPSSGPWDSGQQRRAVNGKNQCVHYWTIVRPEPDVRGPEGGIHDVTLVRRERHCTAHGEPDDLGDGGTRMPMYCNRYKEGPTPYDAAFEEAEPDPSPHMGPATAQSTDAVISAQVQSLIAEARMRPADQEPSVYPAPKDWDADASAPISGWLHLMWLGARTACGMRVVPGSKRVQVAIPDAMDTGPITLKLTAEDRNRFTCPGCHAQQDIREGKRPA